MIKTSATLLLALEGKSNVDRKLGRSYLYSALTSAKIQFMAQSGGGRRRMLFEKILYYFTIRMATVFECWAMLAYLDSIMSGLYKVISYDCITRCENAQKLSCQSWPCLIYPVPASKSSAKAMAFVIVVLMMVVVVVVVAAVVAVAVLIAWRAWILLLIPPKRMRGLESYALLSNVDSKWFSKS